LLAFSGKIGLAEILVSDFRDDHRRCARAAQIHGQKTAPRTPTTAAARLHWRRRRGGTDKAQGEKPKKPIPCRFPVNRLYLQARQNRT
jgi:hypothetical protein